MDHLCDGVLKPHVVATAEFVDISLQVLGAELVELGFCAGDHLRSDLVGVPILGAYHGGLANRTATRVQLLALMLILLPAAEIRLVSFNRYSERGFVVVIPPKRFPDAL